jgi:hypothetical protein
MLKVNVSQTMQLRMQLSRTWVISLVCCHLRFNYVLTIAKWLLELKRSFGLLGMIGFAFSIVTRYCVLQYIMPER